MDKRDEAAWNRRTLIKASAAGAAMLSPAFSTMVHAATGDVAAVKAAVGARKAVTVQKLRDWIAVPTIAAEQRNIKEGVAQMIALARDSGFANAKEIPTGGVPSVFGTIDVGAPTWVAVYFMYDVKQYDPAEWTSPPLEGQLVDRPGLGKVMIGRGTVNTKGPQMAFLAALDAFKAAKRKLPVNVVLIAEGEEEIASTNFHNAIRNPEVHAALKKCSGIFIPFAGQSLNGNVSVDLGAKGALELELVSSGEKWGRGPTKDIHSSNFARVDSPAWHLVQALNTLMKPDGHTIAVEGWYDNVKPLTARQKELIADTARRTSEEEAKKMLGVQRWIRDEDWQTSLERFVSQPTMNIQGLTGGYMGPGGKTVLPHRATAKMEFRLVPDMTREEAEQKFKAHLAKHGFGDIEVNVTGGYGPTETEEDSVIVRAQKAMLERAGVGYSINPRLAGSWPGVVFTGPPLNLPAAQIGLGHGGLAHSPDEFYLIDSNNPKVAGMDGATSAYVDLLYEVAAQARTRK